MTNTIKIGWAKRSIAPEGAVPITGQLPLRAPNGLDIAEQVRQGVIKVFSNLDKIDPDRIQKILEERIAK